MTTVILEAERSYTPAELNKFLKPTSIEQSGDTALLTDCDIMGEPEVSGLEGHRRFPLVKLLMSEGEMHAWTHLGRDSPDLLIQGLIISSYR